MLNEMITPQLQFRRADAAICQPSYPTSESTQSERNDTCPAKVTVIAIRGRAIEEADVSPHREDDVPIRVSLQSCSGVTDMRVLAGLEYIRKISVNKCGALQGFAALRELPKLRIMLINNSDISDVDLRDIGSIPTLEALNLSCCQAPISASYLIGLSALRAIHLCGTSITDEDVDDLGDHRNLVVVDLRKCERITEVSPLTFVNTLEVLLLNDCKNVSHVGPLHHLSKLRVLDLSGTVITDQSMSMLSHTDSLKKIYLNHCVHLKDISPLHSVSTLEELHLKGCKNVAIIGKVGQLLHLRVIDLTGTSVTDECVEGLSKSPSLIKVYLNHCVHLKDVSPLHSVSTLEELHLKGCKNVAIMGDVSKLPKMRVINLRGSAITDAEVNAFGYMQGLVSMDLSGCGQLTNISPLTFLKSLEALLLKDCKNLEHIGSLNSLLHLRVIDLTGTSVTDECVEGLSKSPSLIKVYLNHCVHLKDVSPLHSVSTLEELHLKGCKNVAIMGDVSKLPKMRVINLRGSAITDAEVSALGHSQSVMYLDLSCCQKLTEASPLAHMRTLEVLLLKRCNNLKHIGPLRNLPKLRELELSYTSMTTNNVRSLQKNKTLKSIYMNNCSDLCDVSPFASIITLEKMYLAECSKLTTIGDIGKLPRLKELSLRCAGIQDNAVQAIGESRTLRMIDLTGCNSITDVSPLASIPTLETLHVGQCKKLEEIGTLYELPHVKLNGILLYQFSSEIKIKEGIEE